MAKVVIFAGAGASKAVNKEIFPTTAEFFERLPDKIASDSIFSLAVEFLKKSDGSRQVDIEEVLWQLQELLELSQDFYQEKTIIGYALNSGRLKNIFNQNTMESFGILESVLSGTRQKCSNLIGEINAEVYDLYGQEPEENDLKDNWIYLLNKLDRRYVYYDIFTTNYDIVIETAVSTIDDLLLDDFIGVTGRVSKKLNLDRWKSKKNYGPIIDKYRPLLTKLHGSINWKFDKGNIQVGDGVYTGDHRKHAIIYPGFKGQSESEFFSPMHAFLGEAFAEAEVIIFIGFAFRDEYINDMISDLISNNAKIFVINPSKEIKFPTRRLKPQFINRGFDKDSIDIVVKDIILRSAKVKSGPE
jgi:hypothetical protein